MSADLRSPRWYLEPWAILIFGMVCLPLGIYLTLRTPQLSRLTRGLVVGAIGAVLVGAGVLEYRHGWIDRGLARLAAFTLRQRALFLELRGDHDRATSEALRAFSLYPDDLGAVHAAGLAAAKGGRPRLALSFLYCALGDGHEPEQVLLDLVEVYTSFAATTARGDALLSTSLDRRRIDPGGAACLLLLAQKELRAGDLDSAEYHLREIVRQFRRDLYDRAYRTLAEIDRRRGETELEIRHLCESLRVDPRHLATQAALEAAISQRGLARAPFAALVRGGYLREMGAQEQMQALYQKVLSTHPRFLYADGVLYSLATLHFYYRRDYPAALEHYRKIVDGHPASESRLRSLYQAGHCLERLGRDEEAARRYRQVREEAPKGASLAAMAGLQLTRMRRLGRQGGWLEDLARGASGAGL